MINKIIISSIILISILMSSLSARELIKNGEFNNSFTGWTDWKLSEAIVYDKSIDTTGLLSGPNSALFDILAGSSTDWHIQFHNSDFISQRTANYYISYKAGFDGPMETLSLPCAVPCKLSKSDR